MPTENWSEIKKILPQILALPSQEREAALIRLCGHDDSLRDTVQSLLEYEGDVSQLLTEPFVNPQNKTDEPLKYKPGQQIGAYQIKHTLGFGGMGVVYLAHRADDLYQKDVAIKILKSDMAYQEIGRKFSNERQILANLNHPNIARLFDGGTTQFGDPYFVMEYIEGENLGVFCRNDLSLSERLVLFLKICETVQHAHDAGIIHRDIKPSNILVAPSGEPKLLDFGIAKILNPSHGDVSKTQTHWRLMTPKFASPEQIWGNSVDQRTDVYGLGNLLYLILTGSHPLSQTAEDESAIRERICKKRPLAPSQLLRQEELTSPTGEQDNATRNTHSYIRKMSGDLDQIVLHCLEKSPIDRYQSVNGLQEDLKRFINGRPILAKPASLFDKTWKSVARHRKLTLAALAFTLATLTLITWTILEQRAVRQEQISVNQANSAAQEERDRAKTILAFSMSIFDQYDPMVDGNDKIPTIDILEKATTKLDFDILEDWQSRAKVYQKLGRIFYHLHQFDRSKELLEDALQLFQQHDPTNISNVTQTMGYLGGTMLQSGAKLKAEALYSDALCLIESQYGPDSPEAAPYFAGLASCFNGESQTDEAALLAKKALFLFQPLAKKKPESQANLLNTYADVLRKQNQFEQAEEFYLSSIALKNGILEPDHPSLGYSYAELGLLYRHWAKIKESARYYNKALAIFEKKLGQGHGSLALVLGRIGALERLAGRFQASENAYLRAIGNLEKTYGDTHSGLATKYNDIGVLYRVWGRYEDAIPYLEKSRRVIETHGGPEAAVLIYPLNTQASAHLKLDQIAQSERIFQKALDLANRHYDQDHRMMMPLLGGMCGLRTYQGRLQEAEEYGQRAFSQAIRYHKHNPVSLSWYFNLLGDLAKAKGNFELAETYYQEVFGDFNADSTANPIYLTQSLENLTTLYTDWHRWEQANAQCLEALALLQPSMGQESQRFITLLCQYHEIQAQLKLRPTQTQAANGYLPQ